SRCNIEGTERLVDSTMSEQHGFDDIRDMDVRFALLTVTKNPQPGRISNQPADEIETDAMRLAAADNIAEPEDTGTYSQHGGIGGDQSSSRQLARAVSGAGNEGAMILDSLDIAKIAIYATARCIENARNTGAPHRFNDIVRECRAFNEIDLRLGN